MKLHKIQSFEQFYKEPLNEKFLSKYANPKELHNYLLGLFNYDAIIWFDTETTGIPTKGSNHQLTQLAAIATKLTIDEHGVVENDILSSFNMKSALTDETLDIVRKQDKELSPDDPHYKFKSIRGAFSMTRYGESGAKFRTEEEVIKDFMQWIRSYGNNILFVAHNAGFDMGFLNRRSKRWLGHPRFMIYDVLDTKILFQKFFVPFLQTKADQGDEESKENIKLLGRGFGGLPSVKLGSLAAMFEINPEHAHDALADVEMMMEVTSKVVEELLRTDVNYDKRKATAFKRLRNF